MKFPFSWHDFSFDFSCSCSRLLLSARAENRSWKMFFIFISISVNDLCVSSVNEVGALAQHLLWFIYALICCRNHWHIFVDECYELWHLVDIQVSFWFKIAANDAYHWYFTRYFRDSADESRITFYYAFVALVAGFLGMIYGIMVFSSHLLWLLLSHIHQFILVSLVVTVILDIFFLVHSAVMIFKMSKTAIASDNSRFEAEKDR